MRAAASRYWAAIRMLIVLTVVTGLLYPLLVLAIARLPGLRGHADGSLVTVGHTTVGSTQIGQGYTDSKGNPLVQYFQSRPSDAGTGYDPDATSASNLGPENIVDTLANPAVSGDTGKPGQLSLICSRSRSVGKLDGVDGSRPYCTPDGVGAVLAVFFHRGASGPIDRVVSVNQACPATPFVGTYRGVEVTCAAPGSGPSTWDAAVLVPVRGDASAHPVVPPDAVTASASGLDPNISVAYADIQVARVAKARGVPESDVRALVDQYTRGRALGFLGESVVDLLGLNIALDATYPYHG